MDNNQKIDISQFAKNDKGKLSITLVPTQIIRDIAEVRMYGNRKYHASFNWILVDKEKFKDAMMRHLLAFLDDEDSVDPESGIPHYKHLATNMAFICEMKRNDWEERKNHLINIDKDLQNQIKTYIDQGNTKGSNK